MFGEHGADRAVQLLAEHYGRTGEFLARIWSVTGSVAPPADIVDPASGQRASA